MTDHRPGKNPVHIRFGGIPEHLNLPMRLAIESGQFIDQGIDLQWKQFPGGTGAMNRAFRDGHIDMALMLTEGAVVDIAHGGPFRIIGFFMDSPLHWGIHVLSDSVIHSSGQLQGLTFAVSSINSGSHLMARVYAEEMGWEPHHMRFIETFGIHGAIIAMKVSQPRILVWDKYLALPYVKNGEIRLIDECPTPWRSMVAVASQELLTHDPDTVQTVLSIIQDQARYMMGNRHEVLQHMPFRSLQLTDFSDWLETVSWNTDGGIHLQDIHKAAQAMKRLGIIERSISVDEIANHFVFPMVPNAALP